MQTAVCGDAENVDLPRHILSSNYYRNIGTRYHRGEMPRRVISELERWLQDNPQGVWENSWVGLPLDALSPLALRCWKRDLLCDKTKRVLGPRQDHQRFHYDQDGAGHIRIPMSYLLKLALVDAMGSQDDLPASLRDRGLKLADHFLSDNTSPETYSFHVVGLSPDDGMGQAVADESCRRFLLTQLITRFAEQRWGLKESGQDLSVYFAPHPPMRQKQLSEAISDAFYRELFMNPCLSGWERGESKHQYMHLCHQVLSRAQFNSLGRLKEAGIITNNLVVLPSASNISLANNGTHVSLGSNRLSRALAQGQAGLGAAHEKYLGDLVIKFVEHFLPLFVGSYSAAPYRMAFGDFHPEKVLSFLPYELDYTHLRMIWRRWRKKAHLKRKPLGLNIGPFGPGWYDGPLSRILGLKGDFIPDFRLIDYLAAVMGTEQSPSLDGRLDNQERLKQDLAHLGIFDPSMPLYMLYRQREFAQRGFSGFEGRIYSLFASQQEDLARAVEIQNLLTATAFKLIAEGRLTHDHIPDDPQTESERRQIFFCAAIGLPTFFIKQNTGNHLLRILVERTAEVRPSRRYGGYLRVKQKQFRLAALTYLRKEARALIEASGLEDTMADLWDRLTEPGRSALGKLTSGILDELGAKKPLNVEASQFNRAAETYYRQGLCQKNILESWRVIEEDLASPWFRRASQEETARKTLGRIMDGGLPLEFLGRAKKAALAGELEPESLCRLINLVVFVIHLKAHEAEAACSDQNPTPGDSHGTEYAPVY